MKNNHSHNKGLLESFFGPGSSPYGLSIGDRYTSVFSQASDVRAILSHQNGVATVGHDRFKFHDRGGVVRTSYRLVFHPIFSIVLNFVH